MPDWTLATWNVNSIRTRLDHVLEWMAAGHADVLCLQETKVVDDQFPAGAFREAGLSVGFSGQSAYNGVAVVSREPLADVAAGFPGDPDPAQARAISGSFGGVRIVNLYVPNGSAVGSEKYRHKLEWLAALRRWLEAAHDPEQALVLIGDFNIAPEDRDVHNPEAWRDQVLCSDPERAALRLLLAWGLHDLFRRHEPGGGAYTWWDYRAGRFRRNQGLRIDLALGTAALAERTVGARIDKEPRGLDRPSDHAPMLITFRDATESRK